jgi:predicted lipoprotein with Yx(FWY)xxD motif
MKPKVSLAAISVGLLVIAGCGSSSGGNSADAAAPQAKPAATTTAASASTRGPKLKLTGSDYGQILADGRGRALYLFTADHGKGSTCSGDCATAWPPYVVKSAPTEISGAKHGLVGTTRRDDGKLQATYAGHPVYYYEGDHSPGEVNCQAANEFGGYWYVVRSNGTAVR